MWKALARKQRLGYLVAVVVITAATAVLKIFSVHINPTTVALSLLLIVLFVGTAWGSKPAVLASVLGVICFNFFFLPPVGTLSIADPEDWIAFIAFLITAITAGQLSSHAKRRAEEANAARQEIERLYYELQDSFERSSQAKALKQSERLKSALLDAVTHDLRTPLTAIKASVTMLLDDLKDQRADASEQLGEEGRQEMLEVINEETDRLDRFTASLMELARIDAGEMQLRRQSSSLDGIILAAMKRAEPRTREHRIELWLDSELPEINVDEPALVEAVYVLVDNAAKYSEPGSTIRVSANSKSGAEETVCVSVEDQGKGIPRELRERVFDKFFRAMRDGDRAKPSGTGMGLAIAQGIVEAHGGRIWVEDGAGGRGAKFVIALPTNAAEQSSATRFIS
ncbi:MAG TPA: ATP-binding protein [Pyrinomonadaceae bacterium]|nr:ATP-binding protein [Pyrinomonadaceae bacterium]